MKAPRYVGTPVHYFHNILTKRFIILEFRNTEEFNAALTQRQTNYKNIYIVP